MISTKVLQSCELQRAREHRFGLAPEAARRLEGRSYLVTGGGTGFGRAAALALVALGARVTLAARRPDVLEQVGADAAAAGLAADAIDTLPLDLRSPAAIAAAAGVLAAGPPLSGIVHAAALPSTPGCRAPLQEGSVEAWDALLETNVRGPWLLTRHLVPRMLATGGARVVLLTSAAGWSGTAGFGVYNVSKAALNALCASLAGELARDHAGFDIQVNAVDPGEARSEMNRGSDADPLCAASMILHLLAQSWGGPNGCFFHRDGRHLGFGDAQPYPVPLEVDGLARGQALAAAAMDRREQCFLPALLTRDGGHRDRLIYQLLGALLAHLPQPLQIWGGGEIAQHLLGAAPALAGKVARIVDDRPGRQGKSCAGLTVESPDALAPGGTVFFALDDPVEAVRHAQWCAARGIGSQRVGLDAIAQLDARLVPERAWRPAVRSIYPINVPEIAFEPDQDLVLLEVPPRYQPLLPNGIGYVHNIAASTGIRFQTIDLNILLYHRYHQRRILNRLDPVPGPDGRAMPDDPWDIVHCDRWVHPEVLDHFEPDLAEIVDKLAAARPRMVGLSLNGLNREFARRLVGRLRERLPDVVIVVGGFDCMRPRNGRVNFDDFDYMVIGEAELTLPPLLQELAAGRRPTDLPGVLSRDDTPGRSFVPGPVAADLDLYGYPRYEWTDLSLYRTFDGQSLAPVAATRGCAWSRCRFCGECFAFRKRDPERVVEEIHLLARAGMEAIHFNDSDMNGDPDVLLEICRGIIRKRIRIALVGQMRIDRRNTPELLETLRRAGCSHLRYGVDGWNNHTLRLQSKGYTMSVVERVLADSKAAGFTVAVNAVLGVPGETDQDVDEMIENLVRLAPHYDLVENINTLILAAGNEYYENPDRYRIRFRGDREQMYRDHVHSIPAELWYSEEPYIDQSVRLQRLARIVRALQAAGVRIGNWALHRVETLERAAARAEQAAGQPQ